MPPLPNPAAVGHTGDATVAVSTWFGGSLGLTSEPESGGSLRADSPQGGPAGGKSLRHGSRHGGSGRWLGVVQRGPTHHGCRGRGRGLCRSFADVAVPPADHRRREQRQLRRVVPERGAQRELDVGRGQQLRGRRAHAARRLVRRQHVRLEPVTTRADRLAPEPAATHVRAGGARMCAGSFAARPPRSRASAGRAVRAARAWWSASTTASTRRRRGAPTCIGASRAARGRRAASACRGVLERRRLF